MVRIKKHGMTGSPTYNSWAALKQRCNNKGFKQFKDYGGRGIKYDPRWESFARFLEDMGVKPEGTSIDRIDVNGDYTPQNCRWLSFPGQRRGARNTIHIDIKGEIHCYQDWYEKLGFLRHTIRNKVKYEGITYRESLIYHVKRSYGVDLNE